MNLSWEKCVECNSENIFKVPSIQSSTTPLNLQKKTGKIVDDYIRDTKKEIKSEKDKMRRNKF